MRQVKKPFEVKLFSVAGWTVGGPKTTRAFINCHIKIKGCVNTAEH